MHVFKTPFRKNKLLTKLNRIFNPPRKTNLAEEISQEKLKRAKDNLILNEKNIQQICFQKLEYQEIQVAGLSERENLRLNEILSGQECMAEDSDNANKS